MFRSRRGLAAFFSVALPRRNAYVLRFLVAARSRPGLVHAGSSRGPAVRVRRSGRRSPTLSVRKHAALGSARSGSYRSVPSRSPAGAMSLPEGAVMRADVTRVHVTRAKRSRSCRRPGGRVRCGRSSDRLATATGSGRNSRRLHEAASCSWRAASGWVAEVVRGQPALGATSGWLSSGWLSSRAEKSLSGSVDDSAD